MTIEYSKWIKQFKEFGNLLIYQNELNWSNYYYNKFNYNLDENNLNLLLMYDNRIIKGQTINQILGKSYKNNLYKKCKQN